MSGMASRGCARQLFRPVTAVNNTKAVDAIGFHLFLSWRLVYKTRLRSSDLVAPMCAARYAVPLRQTQPGRNDAPAAVGAATCGISLGCEIQLASRRLGSWMTGVNRNVEGKQKPRIMRYSGGHPAYREHCDAITAAGYRTLALA